MLLAWVPIKMRFRWCSSQQQSSTKDRAGPPPEREEWRSSIKQSVGWHNARERNQIRSGRGGRRFKIRRHHSHCGVDNRTQQPSFWVGNRWQFWERLNKSRIKKLELNIWKHWLGIWSNKPHIFVLSRLNKKHRVESPKKHFPANAYALTSCQTSCRKLGRT